MLNSMTDQIDFYCLNFNNNPIRKNKMEEKGNIFKIPINFYSGVSLEDTRISFVENKKIKRTASICYGHLDMLLHFVNNSQKNYAIIMEDDIIIRKSFTEDLPKILDIVIKDSIDILLLGYLCHNPINTYSNFNELITEYTGKDFAIYDYPNDSWGAQMYLISKDQCKMLLNKYYNGYLEKFIFGDSLIPFSADWTITKEGRRFLIFPQRATEEYIENAYEDEGQEICRNKCNSFIKKSDYL